MPIGEAVRRCSFSHCCSCCPSRLRACQALCARLQRMLVVSIGVSAVAGVLPLRSQHMTTDNAPLAVLRNDSMVCGECVLRITNVRICPAREMGASYEQRQRRGLSRHADIASCRKGDMNPSHPTIAPVAQWIRAADYGSAGCRFESCLAHKRNRDFVAVFCFSVCLSCRCANHVALPHMP